jgi:Fur family ferric uptake transcriptional regulator
MSRVDNILHDHGLKKTRLRHAVLSILIQTDKGLSHQDISKALDIEFDRVTLFRTLHSFEESGILHKIIDPNGTAKYAYSTPEKAEPEQGHAHFICLKCEHIFCLDDIFPIQNVSVPDGFKKSTLDVQVKGWCKDCRE